MQEQKEKLENELRFLKDTLEAGLINEEEFNREKERVESKLSEPEKEKKDTAVKAEPESQKEEIKPEEKIAEPEAEEKLLQIRTPEDTQEKIVAEIPKKWIKYTVIGIIILALIIGFSVIGGKDAKTDKKLRTPTAELKEKPIKINLLIINDKNCEICITDRITNVIKQLFPGVIVSYTDFNDTAKKLLDDLDIESLPAYIFDLAIENATNFEKFKTALIKKGDKHFMSPAASGSNYFFKRPIEPKSLELFLADENTIGKKARDNLQEFLSGFGNEIDYTEYIVRGDESTKLKEELGITTFPALLINNQYKIVGVFSADTIRQYFCSVNKLEKCSITLSKEIK